MNGGRVTFIVVGAGACGAMLFACGLTVAGVDVGPGPVPGEDGAPPPSVEQDAGTVPGAPDDAGGDADDERDAGRDRDGGRDAGPIVRVAYAHSPTVLYRIDLETNALSVVGTFGGDCLEQVLDLAVNEAGEAFVTSNQGFYALDVATAKCTRIKAGNYPNALAFVRRGAGGQEELVGYESSTYIRIDVATGTITTIGSLSQGYASSGDLITLPGGGTYLTVVGSGCGDCLIEINPVTGDVVRSLGSLGRSGVYGMAAWGGKLYGFDSSGSMFSMQISGSTVSTSTIPTPSGPTVFYGAGSTGP